MRLHLVFSGLGALGLFSLVFWLPGCAAELGDPDARDLASGGDELRRCAQSGTTLPGVDVSHHNGRIDWERVAGAGTRFAFVRVSDGLYEDTEFDRNWVEARRVGIVRGVYQYFRPERDPIAQADLLLRRMGALEDDDLPPVIDVEADGGMSPAAVSAAVRRWIDYVKAATGRTPIIYTAYYFWRDEVGNADPQGSPLWIANYGVSCPNVPESWSRWAFFQYSESGAVPGIGGSVDRDWFDGDEDALLALTALDRGPASARGAIGMEWSRISDGSYELRAHAPDDVARVEYLVQGYRIASSTRSAGADFPARYARFNVQTTHRLFEVNGYDAAGALVAHGVGSIDSVPGPAAYIREIRSGEYEIGLERPATGAAWIEVSADGFLLTDSVGGGTRTTRMAVRSTLTRLGARTFELRTYDADGTYRGRFTRTLSIE